MKEIRRIRNKELKSLRNSGLWASGFMFTFGCAPTLVSDYMKAATLHTCPPFMFTVDFANKKLIPFNYYCCCSPPPPPPSSSPACPPSHFLLLPPPPPPPSSSWQFFGTFSIFSANVVSYALCSQSCFSGCYHYICHLYFHWKRTYIQQSVCCFITLQCHAVPPCDISRCYCGLYSGRHLLLLPLRIGERFQT